MRSARDGVGALEPVPDDEALWDDRPRTRGDCVSAPRPCPYVSCRHHIYLDSSPSTGRLHINQPGVEVEDLAESCVLDVAERGGMTLEEVAQLLGVTRERVRQLEAKALQKIEKRVRRLDAAEPLPRRLPPAERPRRLYVLQTIEPAPKIAPAPRAVAAPAPAPTMPKPPPTPIVVEARNLPPPVVEAPTQAPERAVETPPAPPRAAPRSVYAILHIRRRVAGPPAHPPAPAPSSPATPAPAPPQQQQKTSAEVDAARIAAILPMKPPTRKRAADDDWPLWERA